MSASNGTPDIVVAHTERGRIGINDSEIGRGARFEMKQHSKNKIYRTFA